MSRRTRRGARSLRKPSPAIRRHGGRGGSSHSRSRSRSNSRSHG